MNETADADSAQKSRVVPPFPGLRPFSPRDHRYFFGREDQTFALYRLLRNNHFVAVVGSSGSGKSSIVRAGLLPLLDEENDQSGKKIWQCAAMRPGRDPINRLANALAKIAGGEHTAFFGARRDRFVAMLRASSGGISETLAHISLEAETQLVLVVDQFEELFRYLSTGSQVPDRPETARRREEATNFTQLILAATRSYDSRVRVVITMRSDFIGDCARFQGLPEAVSAAQFLVPSLSRDQREEAIRMPIELSDATIDSELVERLLNDSADELDQLPVLQHCLARLWIRAGSVDASTQPTGPIRHLTEQDYRDIGGLAGALSGHADEIFSALPGRETTVEQVFRALAEVDKEGRAIRRLRPLARLLEETGASPEDVFAVLDRFRADECSFIVPPLSLAPTTDLSGDTVIDVGHEALLRRWKRVSGDPEATGERADKRDIGWLRQEQRDGERYQFLRSCVDPESSNESRLSDDQVRRYWDWWNRWKPNPTWAERYGGRFDEVERLVKTSYAASRHSRWRKRGTYAAAVGVVTLIGFGGIYLLEQRRQAENTFKLTVSSAANFSRKILDIFNSGEMTTLGAVELQKVAAEMYNRAGELKDNSATSALRAAWLLADSDLEDALGKKDQVRAKVREAENNARKYLAGEPDNRQWQELLYGSLFRIGDLDLRQFITSRDLKLFDLAAAEYRESERIAEKLLGGELALPRFEVADADAFAGRRFDLAFATNKVGEAMQVGGDIEGALKKYYEALDLAVLLENAPRMDWKLQSATTKIKIAGAFLAKKPRDFENALRNYSDAIEREEALFSKEKSNNIVRSNLAAAYEGRAHAFELQGTFDEAFKGYADAVTMFSRLVEDDARDTKWLEKLAYVHNKFGSALENYARLRGEPLHKAIEQYKSEVAVRGRLTEKEPSGLAWQQSLRESQERLLRVESAAATRAPGKSAGDAAH